MWNAKEAHYNHNTIYIPSVKSTPPDICSYQPCSFFPHVSTHEYPIGSC